jgi:hypothetical protein
MDVVLCAYCVVQKGERRGEERVGVGDREKYPGAPPLHLRKKERKRKKQLADRKVPERPGVVKGEGYIKKKLSGVQKVYSLSSILMLLIARLL